MRVAVMVSAIGFCDLQCVRKFRSAELRWVSRQFSLFPRILVSIDSFLNLSIEVCTDSQTVLDQDLAKRLDADAFDESISAFLILSVLAVVLHEPAHVEQHGVMRIDRAQQIALPNTPARCAAD